MNSAVKMFRFLVVLVASSLVLPGEAVDDATKDTELLFTFLVHRHGDRTIASAADATYTDATEALLKATEAYGYGQLTQKGKQTAYNLGLYIRKRYQELLAPMFNRSEVYIRSTDFTRTKMTILSALAAIYPPVEPRWSKSTNWEPVPYTTLPVLYDYNEPTFNCPVYRSKFYALIPDKPSVMTKFSTLLDQLTSILGIDFITYPLVVTNVWNVLESQVSVGIPLSSVLAPLYDEIKEAAAAASEYFYAQEDNLSFQAGPLLNDFFEQAALVISGNTTQRLRIYSAHDLNVYGFESIIQATPKQGLVKYAAALSLELRRNIYSGEYVILPVYLPMPGEAPVYLNIEGCDRLPCSYDQFYQIASPYALDEDSWRTECGWTPDIVLDESYIQ